MLVTWLPVTLTANGTSNGTVVTGYSVLVNGQKVKDVASPTGERSYPLSAASTRFDLILPQNVSRSVAVKGWIANRSMHLAI
jgi:hypothetical protein